MVQGFVVSGFERFGGPFGLKGGLLGLSGFRV